MLLPLFVPVLICHNGVMKNREEYDWLNDPFDEKKIAEEREQAKMSGCSRIGLLIAIIAVIIILILFFVVSCSAFMIGS